MTTMTVIGLALAKASPMWGTALIVLVAGAIAEARRGL